MRFYNKRAWLALSDHVTLHGVLTQQEDPPHQMLSTISALGPQNCEPNELFISNGLSI